MNFHFVPVNIIGIRCPVCREVCSNDDLRVAGFQVVGERVGHHRDDHANAQGEQLLPLRDQIEIHDQVMQMTVRHMTEALEQMQSQHEGWPERVRRQRERVENLERREREWPETVQRVRERLQARLEEERNALDSLRVTGVDTRSPEWTRRRRALRELESILKPLIIYQIGPRSDSSESESETGINYPYLALLQSTMYNVKMTTFIHTSLDRISVL
jgi:hypothetical protein